MILITGAQVAPYLDITRLTADNPFQPVTVRRRVIEWLEGDAAWKIIDQISTKYTDQPYPEERNASLPSLSPNGRPSASAEPPV